MRGWSGPRPYRPFAPIALSPYRPIGLLPLSPFQQIPQRLPQLPSELGQALDERRLVLGADAGGLGAGAEPLALGDGTPLVREIAVEGIDRAAHHPSGRAPVRGVALEPAVQIERGP